MHSEGRSELIVDDDTLITPSAKDALREYQMKVLRQNKCRDDFSLDTSCRGEEDELDPELVYRVMSRLKEKGLLEEFAGLLENGFPARTETPSDLIGQKQLDDMIEGLTRALRGE